MHAGTQHVCCSTAHSAARARDARVEVVDGDGAHEGHAEVRVRVDASRHDDLAAGIDDAKAGRDLHMLFAV